ncbi:MAG: tetratricopeptide repeat protein, partial [Verrucomicrobiota bacterium]
YELLISLGEKPALSKLDELFALDQFEERPLIWKAELLRRENKLEEAEKVVRQAISIDPSDGEQGPNDRLRAYAVLADIREARGDKKEADFFRGAVNAILLSEKADKFYTAGLLKPAIKMYEDSLNLFADAYCIQSRLAIQLSELGLHDEAEAHYRRAYELMPDSFGRVESHCFGCERAFEGQRAQSLAEKVFSDFAKKSPNKPQVHYLLGYLREEQERYAEALPHFQTAVRLDPAYLNAWKKLQELAKHVRLPKQEHNEIAFNILRLDPLSRHVHSSFENVTDPVGLWNAVETGQKQQPEPATKLLSLDASKAALEKKEAGPKTQEESYQSLYRQMYRSLQAPTPARAVAQMPFVRVATELFGGGNGGYGRYDY